MAEKDILEKTLMDYNDVFSDIVNVLLFHGKRKLNQDALEDANPFSSYEDTNSRKYRSQERDVAKFWKMRQFRMARFGLENQTEAEAYMPFRIIGYDGASYRAQLKKEDGGHKYPVITMILHFDYKKRWDQAKSILECFPEEDEELRACINDYKIHVFEIAYLSDEEVNMFESDFRVVADFFVQMRKNKKYKPKPDTVRHVEEMFALMSELTNDSSYRDVYLKEKKKGRIINNMCEVVEQYKKEGREEGIVEMCKALLQTKGYTMEELSELSRIPIEELAAKLEKV